MNLQSLYLRNFRNFEETFLDFGEKLNVFCGSNAQGKTNLLEAITLLSTGRSFRTQHLSELVKDNAGFFFIEAKIVRDSISQTIRLSFDRQIKRVECNSTHYPSFQSLLGILPSVLFAPIDIDLIAGSPAARRRFLNLHLAQSDPLYFHHLVRFWRAVKQRNTMLRAGTLDGIECWEREMAASALYLWEKRKKLLDEINEGLRSSTAALYCEPIELHYNASQPAQPPFDEAYIAQLQRMRPREKLLGLTLSGPHRDDFTILLDQKPARLYASDGQRRTAIASLRLAQWRRLQQQTGAPPLFGVDDLDLHLDQERQNLFKNALQELGQVFVTTPNLNPIWPAARRFRIVSGQAAIVE